MKIFDSGMPEEVYWESLLDPDCILASLGFGSELQDVAEFGCGYGTFSIPIAKLIRGTLHAFDIDPLMVERTSERAREEQLRNIACSERDLVEMGFGLPAASVDGVTLFNILHFDRPLLLLQHAAAVLRPGGKLFAIHWRHDPATPRGPALETRPKPEQIIGWCESTNWFDADSNVIDLPPWHYGLRLVRTSR